jgi:hypothetical protein
VKVRCLRDRIDDELAKELRLSSDSPRLYGSIAKGREYIVLGLTYECQSSTYGGQPVFEIENDVGSLSLVPAFLFEIVDGSASRHWQFRFRDGCILEFLPPSFFRSYYHDDLSEGVPEVVRDFREVCARFWEEEDERAKRAVP